MARLLLAVQSKAVALLLEPRIIGRQRLLSQITKGERKLSIVRALRATAFAHLVKTMSILSVTVALGFVAHGGETGSGRLHSRIYFALTAGVPSIILKPMNIDAWFEKQIEIGDLYRAEVRLRHLEAVSAFWGTPRPNKEREILSKLRRTS